MQGDTAWWVHRTLADAGRLDRRRLRDAFARIEPLAGWVLRQNGRAIPLEPRLSATAVADGLARLREAHDGESPAPGARAARRRVAAIGATDPSGR